MTSRPKWLTLAPANSSAGNLAEGALPQDISFKINKLLLSAEISLNFRASEDELTARLKLTAKIPIKGLISFSIEAQSHPFPQKDFGFKSSFEKDEVGGSFRKVIAQDGAITLEKSDARTETKALSALPPAPILVHFLAFPALLHSREASQTTYAAVLANGLKFQALRIERLSSRGAVETYEGKIVSLAEPPTEKEWLALPWQNITAFEFDMDSSTGALKAARAVLPLIGRIEIK